MGRFANLAFTPAVKSLQTRMGSRKAYAKLDGVTTADALGEDEMAFIAARDSFYLASVGETGWPYVQHRGGPKGFVRALDAHTLAFADYRGNKQYITAGNVSRDDRVALIFVDYPNQARLKVLAHATVTEDPAVLARLSTPGHGAVIERAVVLNVEALDWNCPQHITPRYTEEEIRPLLERLAALEREVKSLRGKAG